MTIAINSTTAKMMIPFLKRRWVAESSSSSEFIFYSRSFVAKIRVHTPAEILLSLPEGPTPPPFPPATTHAGKRALQPHGSQAKDLQPNAVTTQSSLAKTHRRVLLMERRSTSLHREPDPTNSIAPLPRRPCTYYDPPNRE